MAFRRRGRGSRRAGGRKRQLHWISSHLYFDFTTDGLTSGQPITGWAKWPAGFPDTTTVELRDEPVDETVVREIWSPYASVQGAEAGLAIDDIIQITFGLIAWDTTDPDSLHLALPTPGSVPDPYFGQFDWLLRKCYIFVPGHSIAGLNALAFEGGFPTTDIDSNSRAQRKMPPGTGLLQVVSARIPDGGIIFGQVGNDTRLGVKAP